MQCANNDTLHSDILLFNDYFFYFRERTVYCFAVYFSVSAYFVITGLACGKFLIEIMPVMFIPAGVGLMSSWGTLKPVLVPVSVITVVVIITVMLASGWVSQLIIRRDKKKETENE